MRPPFRAGALALLAAMWLPMESVEAASPVIVDAEISSLSGLEDVSAATIHSPSIVLRIADGLAGRADIRIISDRLHVTLYEEYTLRAGSEPLPVGVQTETITRVVDEFDFADSEAAVSSWYSYGSVIVDQATRLAADHIDSMVLHPALEHTSLSGPGGRFYTIQGKDEPFDVRRFVPSVPAELFGQTSFRAEFRHAFLYNATLEVVQDGMVTVLDPYEGARTIEGAAYPFRWMVLEAPGGLMDVFTDLPPGSAEVVVYGSSAEGVRAPYFWVDNSDGSVSLPNLTTKLDDSILFVEGDLELAFGPSERGANGAYWLSLGGQAVFVLASSGVILPFSLTATAAAAATGFGVALWYFRRFLGRALLPLLLPLYTKLKKPTLLDHERRQALHEVIKAEPGVTFLQLHERFQAIFGKPEKHGFGALAYHLVQLERFGLIVSKREGRFRRYFENGGAFGRETFRIALLQTPPIPDLVRAILEHPGISQQELHMGLPAALIMTRQTVAYHLKRLEEKGLIVIARNGKAKAYLPTDKLRELAPWAVARVASLRRAGPIASPAV